MKITYDPEADAIYIQLRQGKPVDSRDLEEGVTADLDLDGHIIGMEILDARERLGVDAVDSISFEVVTSALRRIA